MTDASDFYPNLDLVLERFVDVPPELAFRGWTYPEMLKQWFCPRPWKTVACEIDLRVGGAFNTTMESPEGERMPASNGCYLEVVPNRKLVFTDAMSSGFRPNAKPFMTGIVEFIPKDGGTLYRATAKHADLETKTSHEEMGFLGGWGTALEQLVELIQRDYA